MVQKSFANILNILKNKYILNSFITISKFMTKMQPETNQEGRIPFQILAEWLVVFECFRPVCNRPIFYPMDI